MSKMQRLLGGILLLCLVLSLGAAVLPMDAAAETVTETSQKYYGVAYNGGTSGSAATFELGVKASVRITFAYTKGLSQLLLFKSGESLSIEPTGVSTSSGNTDGYEFHSTYYFNLEPGKYSIIVHPHKEIYSTAYWLQIKATYEVHTHDYSYSTKKVAPTCSERGYTKHTCSCGDYYKDNYVDKLPHTEVYAEPVAPTCTKTGKEAGTKCSVCGTTMSGRETVPKLPHDTAVEIPKVEPTCSTLGKTTGAKCSVCGTVSVAQEDIPMLPHMEADVAYIPATCTSIGKTAGTKCAVCDAVVVAQKDIPKLSHTQANAPGVGATCTQEGKVDMKICTVCSQEVSYTPIPALGHDAVNYFCQRCGEVDDSVVAAYGDCGDNVQWFGLRSGTLMIRGAGEMWDDPEIPTDSSYKKIVISEGVTRIGSNAFDSSNATSVSIPKTVREIGSNAFANSRLGDVLELPEGVESIGTGAFSNCKITKLYLPSTLEYIGEKAFYKCDKLTFLTEGAAGTSTKINGIYQLYLPKNLTYIGCRAFYGCSKLDGDLIVPDMVWALESYAFYECSYLRGVSLGDCLTKVMPYAFYGCSRMTWIGIGDRISTIEECAFTGTSSLKSINLNHVFYVGEDAFASSASLNSVRLPKQITIDSGAFSVYAISYVNYAGTQSNKNSYVYIASGNTPLTRANWGYGYGESARPSSCPSGHTVRTSAAVAPTCTEPGWSDSQYCVDCGAVTDAKTKIPALGHKYLTDIGYAPTCTEPGLTTGSHCGHCGLVQTAQEEIPALGHSPKTDAAVAPTCEQSGLTEGSHCDVCQVILVQQEEIPALGHDKVAMEEIPSTFYEQGSTGGVHCSVCGCIFQLPRKLPLLSEDVLYGDVDGNGTVNTRDRILLTRYLAGWEGYDEEDINLLAADVNQDGTVNTKDRIILTRYLANWTGYEALPYKK